MTSAYFDSTSPRLLAHRGLHLNAEGIIENSLEAFQNALNHGATHIESDVHASQDQIAFLFHDKDLMRTFGVAKPIAKLRSEEISEISSGAIPTLEQALEEFPNAKFNLDIKSKPAIFPSVKVIEKLKAHNRVLISSFSESRRRKALSLLSEPVATSASTRLVLASYLAYLIGSESLMSKVLQDVDALQLPRRAMGLGFDSPNFIQAISKHGVELHYWTVNNPDEMLELLELGAHGIVTDRVDLFPRNA